MVYNNISRVIDLIPYFDRNGASSITWAEDARKIILTIPEQIRKDPDSTYQDPQCGTGLDALVLADQLMKDLQKAIPDPTQRLYHIFYKQIFLGDKDGYQVLIARANIKRALGDRTFEPNVYIEDCFSNQRKTTVTFGSIDFSTTKKFIDYYLRLSDHVVVITKPSKNPYLKSKINEIESYEYLRRVNNTPMCLIHVPRHKTNSKVTFVSGDKKIEVEDPKTFPAEDFNGWMYAQEVLAQCFEGYRASSGPEQGKFEYSSGSVPLVFKHWMSLADSNKKLKESRDKNGKFNVMMISKRSLTDNMGYGKSKLCVAKNGNPGQIPSFYWDNGNLACSAQVPWIPMSKKEFDKLVNAINNEPCYNILFKAVLIKTHTKDFWSKIPKIKYLPELQKIYAKYY